MFLDQQSFLFQIFMATFILVVVERTRKYKLCVT